MRFRHLFMFGGSLVVLAALLATDPDTGWVQHLPFGGPVVAWMLQLSRGLVVLAAAHLGRKAFLDYPESDLRILFRKARETPIGAGLAIVGVAIILNAVIGAFSAANAQIPERAHQYLPTLKAEITEHWPQIPMRHYVPGLIDHESGCPGIKAMCWSPTARLKTAREEGAGMGQVTRAWHPNGKLRFDALAEMRARHPALSSMSWSTIYQRPDHQLRAVVLKLRDDYTSLSAVRDPLQRLAMTDAAYNGGIGGLHAERRACGLSARCDAQQWWGHVERHCLKSRAVLYGTRSACDINRFHVADVLLRRAPKYRGFV